MKHVKAFTMISALLFSTASFASELQIRVHGLRQTTGSIFHQHLRKR